MDHNENVNVSDYIELRKTYIYSARYKQNIYICSHTKKLKGAGAPFLITKILDIKHRIIEIIESELASTDCFLVNTRSNEAGTDLRFFIDGKNGVGIQTCARLSRKVSRILDEEYEEETPLRYEISSPGVDQPLLDKRQYEQHIGRDLEIAFGEAEIITGELTHINESSVEIEVPISKKINEKKTIAFDEIKTCTVQISFKQKKK